MKKLGDAFYNLNELAHLRYNRNLRPISSVLRKTLKELGIYDKIIAAKIEKFWQQLVGFQIARATAEIKLINHRLYIKVLSPSARQELMMRRTQILNFLRKYLDLNDLEDVVIY